MQRSAYARNFGILAILSPYLIVLFLHCWNRDSLAVVAVAHFDLHLAGRHLADIGSTDDCFCRLRLWLVINILQNKVQFDPRSLKKLICS